MSIVHYFARITRFKCRNHLSQFNSERKIPSLTDLSMIWVKGSMKTYMYLLVTYAYITSRPALLFFISNMTFLTSTVVISGKKILFATLFMKDM